MMLNNTDNSTKCKTGLQAVDTTRKAGDPGESEGCMEGAFFRGKGKRSSKQQEGCNEWGIQAGKGTAGGLNVTRGRENPSAGCKQGYLC